MKNENTKPKAVVIVDGFSPGSFLAPRFRAQKISCIHLLSRTALPEGCTATRIIPSEKTNLPYGMTLIFDGDYNAVIRDLDAYSIIGVIPGTGIAVPHVDALSERMGLPTNGTQLSMTRQNNYLMQTTVHNAGVPTKAFFCTDNEQDILAWAGSEDMKNVVIKPVSSTSTGEVTFCSSDEEISRAFRDLVGTNHPSGDKNTKVLAEEQLDGIKFGVNTVSWDGKHRLAELWRYHNIRVQGAGRVYDSACLCDRPDEILMPLVRYAFKILDALGIRYGPAHTEVMLTKKGPLIIDSVAQVTSDIPPDLIVTCAGQSQVDLTVQAYSDPVAFLAGIDTPYRISRHMIQKYLITGYDGAPSGENSTRDTVANLKNCVRGDLVSGISDWHVHRTMDRMTGPANVFLIHKDERIVLADYRAIREYERNHEPVHPEGKPAS